MDLQNETSVVAALRREPERAALLFKLSAVTAILLVAWDVLAAAVLPAVAVTAVLVIMLLAYGATTTVIMGRGMASSRRWVRGSAASADRLTADPSSRATTRKALLRRAHDLDVDDDAWEEEDEDEDETPPVHQEAPPIPETIAFNESYFLLRLRDQVKDARRNGEEMCVAAVHVTVPGADMTADIGEHVAVEMARIAASQARVMSQPLALSDSEYVFSLPHTGSAETKQFVREIMHAFGDFWCYFGIAAFPGHGTTAEALVERARIACETSRRSGRQGRVEYYVA